MELRFAPAARPPVRILLARRIPPETGVRAVLQQCLFLGRHRLKTEPRHASTLTTTTDTTREGSAIPIRPEGPSILARIK
jgi:hypothetical protein